MTRQRILVVDDDAAVRSVIERTLGPLGYLVVVAGSAEQACRQARSFQPDLAILDLVLPGTNGCIVHQKLRLIPGLEDIPALYITGFRDRADLVTGLTSDSKSVLLKPFDSEELARSVELRLKHSGKLRALPKRSEKIAMDRATQRVRIGERSFQVPGVRFKLIAALGKKQGHVVSLEELSRSVWAGPPDPHKVKVNIARLRKDLGPDGKVVILAAPGGYKLAFRKLF